MENHKGVQFATLQTDEIIARIRIVQFRSYPMKLVRMGENIDWSKVRWNLTPEEEIEAYRLAREAFTAALARIAHAKAQGEITREKNRRC